MCGICGVVGTEVTQSVIKNQLDLISHRGPDANGHYQNGDCFIGHVRLSILDLSESANQPMVSSDGHYKMVYNGEVYNFQELRRELEGLGFSFRTGSDTEVIINGFTVWGDELFERLNGIFALAIWQEASRTLTIARDRFGVKPLYYSFKSGVLCFGSEIKTMLTVLTANEINNQALREFLDYGNPLGEQTLFEGISELSPGSSITYCEGKIAKKTFWDIDRVSPIVVTDKEAIEQTRDLLDKAVHRQLVSDVPVGVFLSGGIDSSMVTAFASKHLGGSELSTYTAAFDFDIGVNELESAKRVANHFGTNHHELFIEGKNLPQVVDQLVVQHDSPFSDAANIPLYLLTKQLGGTVKVILQGDGGDEFFAGYRRYQLLQQYGSKAYRALFNMAHHTVGKFAPARFRRMFAALHASDDIELMACLLTVDTSERSAYNCLTADTRKSLSGNNPYDWYRKIDQLTEERDLVQRMLRIDTKTILTRTYLEKVDKSTMANSIEVRVPMLDNLLTDFVLSLPGHQKIRGGEKKWLLKKALRGVVPDFVLDGKKTGFGVPYENWIKGPLCEMYEDTVRSQYFKDLGVFDLAHLEKLMKEHKSGERNNGFILWKIFHFGLWSQKYQMKLG